MRAARPSGCRVASSTGPDRASDATSERPRTAHAQPRRRVWFYDFAPRYMYRRFASIARIFAEIYIAAAANRCAAPQRIAEATFACSRSALSAHSSQPIPESPAAASCAPRHGARPMVPPIRIPTPLSQRAVRPVPPPLRRTLPPLPLCSPRTPTPALAPSRGHVAHRVSGRRGEPQRAPSDQSAR